MGPKLSLVVPTFNEAGSLPTLIESIHASLDGCHYEVVVVDDSSTDGTRQVAENAARRYPVRLIRRDGERGLASAVVAGFKQARGDYVGVMDADLQHPPEIIPRLLQHLENGADLAIASRYVSGGSVRDWATYRKVVSLGATMMARMLLASPRKVRDPLSGFFLVKKRVVENIELNPIGCKVLLEILVKAQGAKCVEVPYVFRARCAGNSKLGVREYIGYVRQLSSLVCWDASR